MALILCQVPQAALAAEEGTDGEQVTAVGEAAEEVITEAPEAEAEKTEAKRRADEAAVTKKNPAEILPGKREAL